NLLYVLKMTENILAAYACAFAIMMAVFYALPDSGTNLAVRYFTSLAFSFCYLSLYSLYCHVVAFRKIANPIGLDSESQSKIPFYKSQGTVKKTLKSRFSVQSFELLPNFMSGLFFFVVLFGDRILSWLFNPQKLTISNTHVSFSFNNQYYACADLSF